MSDAVMPRDATANAASEADASRHDGAARWELSKENLQPVKSGRSVRALGDASAIASGDCEAVKETMAKLEREKTDFEETLRTYDGDDKLGVWIAYLKWHQTSYPTLSRQAETLQLLERCTNDLFDNDQFKTDPRFLRVWIQYADLVREPEDIFRFLQVHSIGQDFALFYEAYALFLEKRGAHKDAMGVYELGIGRFAFPVERLRKKLTDFHKRMARRAARDARRATPMSISRSEQSIPSRAALSSLRSASGFGAMGTAPSAAFGGGSGGGGGGNENAGEGLCVYTDTPTHEAGSHGAAALSSLQRQVASDWTRVGSQRDVSKENEGMADKWSDYSIAPGTAGRPPQNQAAQADAFSVLVDEEFVEPAPFAAAGQHQGVRGAVEGKQRGGRAKTKPSVSVLAFSEELSKDACGEDVSFEELRAMRYATNRPHKTHTTTGEGGNEGGEVSCAPPPAGNAGAAAEAETAAEAPGAASPAEPSVRCAGSVGGVCLDDPGTGPLDDVTLCTKEAFATIDAMFTTQSGCVARTKPARLENGRPVAAHEGDTAPLDTPLVMSRVSQRLDFEDRNLEVSVYEDTTLLPSDTADIILGRQGAAAEGRGLGAGTEAGEGDGAGGEAGQPDDKENAGGVGVESAGACDVLAPPAAVSVLASSGGLGGLLSDDDDDIFERDENLLELPEDRLRSLCLEATEDFNIFEDTLG